MREIKFRAWDKLNNEWCAIDMAYSDAIQGPISKPTVFNGRNQCVIMQYTGLKDKNGVEIYEGDLLGNTMEGFAIAWDEELYSFWPINQYMPEDKFDVHWYDIVEMAGQGRIEVIGNIWEHGHLLENESKE